MSELIYTEKVVETFGERSLRSAYIIDDQFPTYADLLRGNGDKFSEGEIARDLHEFFRKRGIPCDVENLVEGKVSEDHIDRIRKTDLIVLDYNLDSTNHTDSKTAIDILGRLADTSHFNMVVVYTKAENLDRVWQEVAASLKGGWERPKSERHAEVLRIWQGGLDEAIPELPKEILHAVLRGTEPERPGIDVFRKELLDASTSEDGKPTLERGDLGALVEELARIEVRSLLQHHHEEEIRRPRDIVANCSGRIRWVQVGQCFIAVMGKPNSGHGEAVTPDHIMENLHQALVDWKPSLLQIIVAKIQNILEQKPLATEAGSLKDPDLHVGLTYYLLWSLPHEIDADRPGDLMPFVSLIIAKLVDNIRRRVTEDVDLNASAAAVLMDELKAKKWIGEEKGGDDREKNEKPKRPRLFATAKEMSNIVPGRMPKNEDDLLLKLNAFLSAERFEREAVTTGTVFAMAGREECYICLTPACDMVPREPGDKQKWMHAMHPVRPIMAVRLHEHRPPLAAIGKAEQGRYVFIDHVGRGIRSFAVFDDANGQPVVEMIFASDAAKIFLAEGSGNKSFRGQLVSQEKGTGSLTDAVFEIVGQVRDNYASRYLDMLGHHMSRIGVDFVASQKQ